MNKKISLFFLIGLISILLGCSETSAPSGVALKGGENVMPPLQKFCKKDSDCLSLNECRKAECTPCGECEPVTYTNLCKCINSSCTKTTETPLRSVQSPYCGCDLMGDATKDGKIDCEDAKEIINFLFEGGTLEVQEYCLDVDFSGETNQADLILLTEQYDLQCMCGDDQCLNGETPEYCPQDCIELDLDINIKTEKNSYKVGEEIRITGVE
jgi:hypothetical protein